MKTPLLFLLLIGSSYANAQHINTLAGNGVAGFSGDNSPATAAMINSPYGVAADAAGNVYFTDRLNNRVRKVNAAGIITTIAGTGTAGYNGDNIPATDAQLFDPSGVAVDGAWNLYIADKSNNRIRKINASGMITTIAGTGIASFGGDNAAATLAAINNPRGVAADAAGNIFIADQANNRVRKINASGIITTVAGNGSIGFSGDNAPATAAMLNGPYAIAADNAGNIYISDVDNERIRKVSAAGIIATAAGTGVSGYNGDGIMATDAQLSEPIGIAVNAAGDLFIADAWNYRIRKVNAAGIISTTAGTGASGFSGDGGSALSAQFNNTYGIALTFAGQMVIADYGNNRIRYTYNDVGVDNPDQLVGVNLWPNPSHDGRVMIHVFSKQNERITVSVYNLLGRQIYYTEGSTNELLNVDLDAISGMCLLDIATNKVTYRRQVMITR